MKERILITGGAGYLGSILIRHLLTKGYKVTCLDNLYHGQKSILPYADNPNFDFIYGDVRNKELLKEILPNFDVILPLAAIVGQPACDRKPIEAQAINYDAILMLNELRSPNQKLIYPTTNSGYGCKSGQKYCTEETPLEPISLYGRSKTNAEKKLLASEKPVITLRLATVFGISPKMRIDLLVNHFVYNAINDGYIVIYEREFCRNYVHIKDIARVFEFCIQNFDSMKNEAYNVGLDDANLNKAQLAEKIKDYVPNFEIIYGEIGEDPDKRNYIVSNKKLLSTGFKFKYSLDDGIKELIKGYKILLPNNPYKNI